MKKTIILIFMTLLLSSISYASECSRTVACNCGDTLIESKELSIFDNLNYCLGEFALKVENDNVEISCFEGEITSGHINPIVSGILVSGDNFSIKNCNISGFYNAVEIHNSNLGLIYNNSFNHNFASGLELVNSNFYNISNNVMNNNSWDGIFLINSSNNNIYNNTLRYNTIDGIQIFYGSYNNLISKNDMVGNLGHAIAPIVCNNFIDDNNIGGNGKSIRYIENQNNIEISNTNEFSEIIFCNVNNSKISNVVLDNKENKNDGILLVNSNNNEILNSDFLNLRAGIYLFNSYNNKIENNLFENNQFALRFMDSSNNQINLNSFNDNDIFFYFNNSNENTFSLNNIYDLGFNLDYNAYSQIYLDENLKISLQGNISIEIGEKISQEPLFKFSFLLFIGVFFFLIFLILIFFFIFKKS